MSKQNKAIKMDPEEQSDVSDEDPTEIDLATFAQHQAPESIPNTHLSDLIDSVEAKPPPVPEPSEVSLKKLEVVEIPEPEEKEAPPPKEKGPLTLMTTIRQRLGPEGAKKKGVGGVLTRQMQGLFGGALLGDGELGTKDHELPGSPSKRGVPRSVLLLGTVAIVCSLAWMVSQSRTRTATNSALKDSSELELALQSGSLSLAERLRGICLRLF